MAVRAMNFKMDEVQIDDVKHVASVYHMTITDLIKEANVEEADAAESAEILDAISSMENDDLAISSSERFTV